MEQRVNNEAGSILLLTEGGYIEQMIDLSNATRKATDSLSTSFIISSNV